MSGSENLEKMALLACQWHLVHVQLVNWGTFCGYQHLRLLDENGAPARVAMITGESGTGKSTLFDAKTAVLMRGTARFNAASNQTYGRARGSRERNLYSYVLGKQDDEYDPATGEARESYLRSTTTANWSAIALTFACTTGETFCAMRLYYVGAHAPGTPDVWYLTADEELDPRAMAAHATTKFARATLRSTYPAATIHEGQEVFLRSVYRKLGIGHDGEGDSAMKLQERIQAGTTITDVDALFKDLVIDEPSTYAKAEEACGAFREHETTWEAMDEARRKTAALATIRQRKATIEALTEERDCLDSCRPGEEGPLALWTARRRATVLAGYADECDNAVGELDLQAAAQERRIAQEQVELERLREEVNERGGGAIDRLERDAETMRERLRGVRDLRGHIAGYLGDIGRSVPDCEEDFDALIGEAEELLAGYDASRERLDEEILSCKVGERELARKEHDLSEQLEFYRTHPSNITDRMIKDRRRISDATGIPEAELPYAAELMDLAEGQEEWRVAANVGFHGLATLMLVDRSRLDDFSVRLNSLRLDHRISFQGVRPRAFRAPRPEAGRLSSKLVFKEDSPFSAWMAEWVHDAPHDFQCVDRPDELGGHGQRITREGQTRRRSRGAHGFSRDALIIGFSNAGRVSDLQDQLTQVRSQLAQERTRLSRLQAELQSLVRRRDAALQITPLRWDALDIKTVERELGSLLEEIARLRADESLAELIGRRDEKAALVRKLDQELGVIRGNREHNAIKASAAHAAASHSEEEARRLLAVGIAVSDEQRTLIESYAERAEQPHLTDDGSLRLLADAYTATGANNPHAMMAQRIRKRRGAVQEQLDEKVTALEEIFQRYHSDWLSFDDPTGTSIDSYDDYLRVLEELEAEQLDLHIDDWLVDTLRRAGASLAPLARAYTTDLREIRRRMAPINAIMGRFRFGPDAGELEIAISERSPKLVRDFREELSRWARLATQADFDDVDRLHLELRSFMERLEEACAQHARGPLNTKGLVYITVVAHYPSRPDLTDKAYSSLGAKSGGETQELIAFILGAALLFCLGDNGESLPTYAPVFLDEAFIKADERFTRRAIEALVGLGFQVVIAVPTSKVQAVEPVADEYVCITKNPLSGHSHINEMTGVRADA